VEVEGDGVGRFGARLLGQRRGIEHEQEGSLLAVSSTTESSAPSSSAQADGVGTKTGSPG